MSASQRRWRTEEPEYGRISVNAMATEPKVCVLTGGSSGIGLNFAFKLAKRGTHHIIIAVRSKSRGEETEQKIRAAVPECPCQLTFLECDMNSLKSVKSFCDAVLAVAAKIHWLVLNAGIVAGSSMDKATKMSADGLEQTFAVNHLSHFLMLNEFLPALQAAGDAHVAITSSEAHEMGGVVAGRWRAVATGDGSSCFGAYGKSKLANILHAYEANRRYGKGITFNALHPGSIRETGIMREQSSAALFFIDKMLFPMLRLFGKSNTLDEGIIANSISSLRRWRLYLHGIRDNSVRMLC
jgi:NAD(P)-dependent dehydrogenase (short-subunit alcohol dehydrogenase family)